MLVRDELRIDISAPLWWMINDYLGPQKRKNNAVYIVHLSPVSLIYVFISSLVSTLLGWGREKVLLFVGLLTVETTITTSSLEEGVAVTNSNLG